MGLIIAVLVTVVVVFVGFAALSVWLLLSWGMGDDPEEEWFDEAGPPERDAQRSAEGAGSPG